MTPQLKRLAYKFCIAVTVVIAVTMILCGKVLAEERGENILQGTQYKSVMLESGESTITVQVDEGKIVFDRQAVAELLNIKRYIRFTPFAAAEYFISCVKEVI
ncbi:MAG: hypothetical protein NC110_07050 [Ruminococcus sp.]|nr:hypothetical protein [Ruminococcus sp.]